MLAKAGNQNDGRKKAQKAQKSVLILRPFASSCGHQKNEIVTACFLSGLLLSTFPLC
jgi:hypothetical protein